MDGRVRVRPNRDFVSGDPQSEPDTQESPPEPASGGPDRPPGSRAREAIESSLQRKSGQELDEPVRGGTRGPQPRVLAVLAKDFDLAPGGTVLFLGRSPGKVRSPPPCCPPPRKPGAPSGRRPPPPRRSRPAGRVGNALPPRIDRPRVASSHSPRFRDHSSSSAHEEAWGRIGAYSSKVTSR